MSGDDNHQEGLFSHVSPEKSVPADHPLRPIRKMVDEILRRCHRTLRKIKSGVPGITVSRLQNRIELRMIPLWAASEPFRR